jgi:hypothetical protein
MPSYPAGRSLECKIRCAAPAWYQIGWFIGEPFPRGGERTPSSRQMSSSSLIAAGSLLTTSKSHGSRFRNLTERPASTWGPRVIALAASQSQRVFTYLWPSSVCTPQPSWRQGCNEVQPGERRGVLRVQDVREPAAPRLARRAWTEQRNGVVDSHPSISIRHDIEIKAERVTLSGLCSLFLNVGLRGGMQPGALCRRQLEILYILYGLFLLRALNRAQRDRALGQLGKGLSRALQSLSRLVFLVESGGCGVENAYQDPCAVELSSPSKMPIAER